MYLKKFTLNQNSNFLTIIFVLKLNITKNKLFRKTQKPLLERLNEYKSFEVSKNCIRLVKAHIYLIS